MGSFASGFQMGQNAFQQGIDNDRQKAKDARDQADFENRQYEVEYQKTKRKDENAAIDSVGNLQAGVGPEQQGLIKQTYGMTPSQTAAAGAGLQTKLASYDAPDSYDLQTAPAAGAAPAMNAQGLKLQKASALDIERGMGNVARAQKNVEGMRASQANQIKLEYDEEYGNRKEVWNKMSNDEKSGLIKSLSDDVGVKGNGNWTEGKGKLQGYMTYLPPTGDPIQLSNKEAGEVYALSHLMKQDPARARAELDKVSDKVAALASHAFENQTKGVTANNSAVAHAGTVANGLISANASAQVASTGAMVGEEQAGLYRAHASQLGEDTQRRTAAFEAIRPIAEEFNNLSQADQLGERGQALERKAALAGAISSKDASGLLSATRPRGAANGKLPAVLNDQQKILLTQAVKEIGELGPKSNKAAVAEVYTKYGFDPADYGVPGLTNPYAGMPGSGAPAAGGGAHGANAPPALTSMNTQLLQPAGNSGYNVRLPDGSVAVMSKKELMGIGYSFGGGLQTGGHRNPFTN